MTIRLVAFDLDGTLMPRYQSLRPRVIDAVRAAQANGTRVTIATGRLFSMVLPYAQQLGLVTPLISHHGALIKDPATGHELYHQGVPLPIVREIVLLARNRDLPVAAYVQDTVYVDRLKPEWPVYSWLVKIGAQDVGDLTAFLDREPTRVAIVTEAPKTKQLVLELRDYFGDRLHVTSGHPLLAEMSHPDVSKARGLARLAEHLGIDQSEIMAVGDDWNDIEMLSYAGFGVAMGGCPPEVQAVADYIAPSAEEDGAAHVLEKFVLGGR
ncbi:MAG: Cof-type HAD-IIB family hydrolase [Chloroflexota bacterium]